MSSCAYDNTYKATVYKILNLGVAICVHGGFPFPLDVINTINT